MFGNDSEETILGYPVLFKSDIKLSGLVQDAGHIAIGKKKVADVRPRNLLDECVHIFILPLCFARIPLFAFSMAYSFINNEEEHFTTAVFVTKGINHLVTPPAFVKNNSE